MKTTLRNTMVPLMLLFALLACKPVAAQIVTGWDDLGVPDNLGEDYPVTGEMIQAINLALPEWSDIRISHPDYIASDERSRVVLTEEADVWVTFLHEGAGYRNVLGCFFYDPTDPPSSSDDIDHEILFPNASFLNSGGGLETGDTIYLGTRPAGSAIGFWLRANAWNGSGVNDWGWTFYSIMDLNEETDPDLRPHMVLLWQEDDQQLVLSYEDILRTEPSCDQDFNDAVFLVHTNPPEAVDLGDIVDLPGEADADGDGVADHADAYPNDPERASVQYTPSASDFEVLAFEDQWPHKGDYDFNDLVLRYRFRELLHADGGIKEFNMVIEPLARGAAYHNALAIQLPVAEAEIESVELWRDNIVVDASTCLEVDGGNQSVLRVFMDAHDELPSSGSSGFANTVVGEDLVSAPTVEMRVIFVTPILRADLGLPPYNPFIFRSASRGHEIHLLDRPPSTRVIDDYFGSADDISDPSDGRYYRDSNGFPWALILPSDWAHPTERDQISWAYDHFSDWVGSGGESYSDWYDMGQDWDYIWHE